MRRLIVLLALLAVPAAALALNFSVSLHVYRLKGPAGELRTVVYEDDMRGADDVASLLHDALDSAQVGGEVFPGWKLVSRARCFDDDGHGGGPAGVPRCEAADFYASGSGYVRTDLKVEEIPRDWLAAHVLSSAVATTAVGLLLTFPVGWLFYLPFVSLVFPNWTLSRRRCLTLLPYGFVLFTASFFPISPITFGFVVMPLVFVHGACSGVAWYASRFLSWCRAYPERPWAVRALSRPWLIAAIRWSPLVFSVLVATYVFRPFL